MSESLKTKRLTIAAALSIVLTLPAGAAELKVAMNNLAHEYAICAAYFLVVSIGMENSAKPDMAAQYKGVSDNALSMANTAGDQAEILPATTQARFETAFLDMSKKIAGNTSNISILFAEYMDPCTETMSNMKGRMAYWMSK